MGGELLARQGERLLGQTVARYLRGATSKAASRCLRGAFGEKDLVMRIHGELQRRSQGTDLERKWWAHRIAEEFGVHKPRPRRGRPYPEGSPELDDARVRNVKRKAERRDSSTRQVSLPVFLPD